MLKIKNNLDKINYYGILICLLIFPISIFIKYSAIILNFNSVFLFIDLLKCYWIILPLQIFIHFIYLKNKKVTLDRFDYIIYIMIFSGIISSLFAIDYNTSIYGYYGRYEGLMAILSYYLLFLNSRKLNKKNQIKLLNILICLGIFNSIYGILQVIFKVPFVMKFRWYWMASGLNTNPNFFGTFMCLTGLLCICMYLFNNKNNKKFYFISSIIMMIGLVLSQSTGPIIGYICGSLILIFFLIVRKIKVWKKLLKLCLVLIITFFVSVYGTNYLFNNVYKYENIDGYTIKGDIDRIIIYTFENLGFDVKKIKKNTNLSKKQDIKLNEISNNRITIWKNSLPILKDNWLVGVGLDNFGEANIEYYGTNIPDKVHNVYLQILVTNGLIGFIPYIIWLGMVICCGIKKQNNNIIILLIPFIGYSIQAIFNISVVDVAPLFYMLGGMIVGFKEE